MVKPKTPEGDVLVSDNYEAIKEVFVDYKRGLRTLATATEELRKLGFEPVVAELLLKEMKRTNVIDIRGYSLEPMELRGTRKACRKNAAAVKTDNK
jgi:hypothetical protein